MQIEYPWDVVSKKYPDSRRASWQVWTTTGTFLRLNVTNFGCPDPEANFHILDLSSGGSFENRLNSVARVANEDDEDGTAGLGSEVRADFVAASILGARRFGPMCARYVGDVETS